jgi:hypothetical protein
MPATQPPPHVKPAPPEEPVDLATESVAGEEDPGAALEDLVQPPAPPTGHAPAPAKPR